MSAESDARREAYRTAGADLGQAALGEFVRLLGLVGEDLSAEDRARWEEVARYDGELLLRAQSGEDVAELLAVTRARRLTLLERFDAVGARLRRRAYVEAFERIAARGLATGLRLLVMAF